MKHKLIEKNLIDPQKILEDNYNKNYNLIYFFLNSVMREDSFYNEKYSKEEMNHEIYKRINGNFMEYELEGGETLFKTIRFLRNSKIDNTIVG